jgi:hypothetical protein
LRSVAGNRWVRGFAVGHMAGDAPLRCVPRAVRPVRPIEPLQRRDRPRNPGDRLRGRLRWRSFARGGPRQDPESTADRGLGANPRCTALHDREHHKPEACGNHQDRQYGDYGPKPPATLSIRSENAHRAAPPDRDDEQLLPATASR